MARERAGAIEHALRLLACGVRLCAKLPRTNIDGLGRRRATAEGGHARRNRRLHQFAIIVEAPCGTLGIAVQCAERAVGRGEGSEGTLRSLANSTPLVVEHEVDAVPFRRGHAPIAIGTLAKLKAGPR
mgnify:CR=1 FL=1